MGVAPSGRVCYPGGPEGNRVPLEENHSHFILANTNEWGGETRLLITVAEALAGNGSVLVVLAGGGQAAMSEVLRSSAPLSRSKTGLCR